MQYPRGAGIKETNDLGEQAKQRLTMTSPPVLNFQINEDTVAKE